MFLYFLSFPLKCWISREKYGIMYKTTFWLTGFAVLLQTAIFVVLTHVMCLKKLQPFFYTSKCLLSTIKRSRQSEVSKSPSIFVSNKKTHNFFFLFSKHNFATFFPFILSLRMYTSCRIMKIWDANFQVLPSTVSFW